MSKTISGSEKSSTSAVREQRTAARKAKNVAANEARHEANLARVAHLGVVLCEVTDRRKPRQPNRMTPSKALRLHDRAAKFAAA